MYDNLEGYIFVLIFFIFAIIVNYGVLCRFHLNKKAITLFVVLSVTLHFVAGIIGCLFLTNVATGDALGYFYGANFYQKMANSLQDYTSTHLMFRIVYWLRYFIFGDSFLGTFSFFSFLGSLGATVYLVIFHRLLQYVGCEYDFDFHARRIKFFSLLILLWPSVLYWTSNLGKDSLCYFFISLFFLFLLEIKHEARKICRFLSLFFSAVPVFLIRPYLVLVAFFGSFFALFFKRKTLKSVLLNLFLLAILIAIFFPLLNTIVNFLFNSAAGIDELLSKSIFLQKSQAVGTHIPLPTHDPSKTIFFLPYTMLANLFLPMFIFAGNAMGLIASFENFFLLILVVFFFRKIKYWKLFSRKNQFFSISFWFFVSGMVFLGIANTNLGAAMREKTMYLPLLLINMFIVFSVKYKKRKIGNYCE